jgi:hypothetical protein
LAVRRPVLTFEASNIEGHDRFEVSDLKKKNEKN